MRKKAASAATNNPRPNPSMKCGCPPCLKKYPGDRAPATEHTGTWECRYIEPGGRTRSKNKPSESEGIAFLEEIRTQIRQRTYIDPARGEITLCAWHRLWWPTQTGEESTLDRDGRSFTNHIEPYFGSYRLYELTWLEIQSWINGLHDKNGGPLAASSAVKVFQILDRMLTAAKLDLRIPFNPADGIKLPKIHKKHPEDRRPPSYAVLWRIRAFLPKYLHVVQIIAQETGLRFGEIAGLRGCWVDLEGRRIQVRETLTEVGGKIKRKVYPKSDAGMRTVPLTGLACFVLKQLFADEPPSRTVSTPEDGLCEDELVFHGRNKKGRDGKPYRAPLRRTTVDRCWHAARQLAGVARAKVKTVTVTVRDADTGRAKKEKVERTEWWPTFSDQRDAFASKLHRLGVPEVVTQEVLGHERAGAVTWQYTHAAADYAGQVAAAIEDGKRRGRPAAQRLRLVA
ncbi:tyrosine-type recombinase/integrase [Streptomyces sp. IB2014 016-6]|uniref:tyrosine-type recombinase/integrase n=1 Tax=Streptomyces sp. IB2014 016-6 TaxID=2517818 RepID=UPI0011C89999|nr:tyrosine-type recombinase/integrase [Streptomyces sp. IB2014 016-6]TXL91636.1 hypothetical protein EW053_04745 [Streptomyces sp. IB2014 016-6]